MQKIENGRQNEGFLEIGAFSFSRCNSLKINIPNTIKIGRYALFNTNPITPHLLDGIESLGESAFSCCKFANCRSPTLVNTISRGMFDTCQRTFSVEFPVLVIPIKSQAFKWCTYLRNCAFSHETVIEEDAFWGNTDLLEIFDTAEGIIIALRCRLDGLLIHKMCYYKSYHLKAWQDFIHSTNVSSGQPSESNLIESSRQQDCLGMTPLHILAYSTDHHFEIYRFMIDQYPETLIVEDAWEAVSLLYAIWGSPPTENIQLLVNSTMVEHLGGANAPPAVIQKLLNIHQT